MADKLPKIIFLILTIFTILQTFSFLFINLLYTPSSADYSEPPKLQITIFENFKFSIPATCQNDSSKICVNWLGEYISGIYKYAIGFVGILATVVMMVGGIMWIVAGGSATRIGEAKSWIVAASTGLILALTSYLILYQVNPNLTSFKALSVKNVKPIETHNTASNIFSVCQDKFGTVISVSGNDESRAYAECSRQCSPNPISENSFLFNNNYNYCCLCDESPGADGYCMSQGFCLPLPVSLEDCQLSGGEFYCSDINCTTNCFPVDPADEENEEEPVYIYDCDSWFWVELSTGSIITQNYTQTDTDEADCLAFHDNNRILLEQVIAEESYYTRITDDRVMLIAVQIIN